MPSMPGYPFAAGPAPRNQPLMRQCGSATAIPGLWISRGTIRASTLHPHNQVGVAMYCSIEAVASSCPFCLSYALVHCLVPLTGVHVSAVRDPTAHVLIQPEAEIETYVSFPGYS